MTFDIGATSGTMCKDKCGWNIPTRSWEGGGEGAQQWFRTHKVDIYSGNELLGIISGAKQAELEGILLGFGLARRYRVIRFCIESDCTNVA